jgi:hypothetical protein
MAKLNGTPTATAITKPTAARTGGRIPPAEPVLLNYPVEAGGRTLSLPAALGVVTLAGLRLLAESCYAADDLTMVHSSTVVGHRLMHGNAGGKVTEIPTSLEMRVGGERNVELPSLGTAGYVWDAEIVGAADVIDVHWTRGDPPGSLPPGPSAPEVASIRAVAPGDGELRLYQHRRWESATQTIARHDIHVHVTPA